MQASGPSPDTAGGGSEAQRNARYAYLLGRLRNRQITMDEATELFGLMNGMLRASEAARIALAGRVPGPPEAAPGAPRRAAAPVAAGGGDDLFLVGLLAMGAGAGLLAAMARRVADGAPSPPSGASGRRGGSA